MDIDHLFGNDMAGPASGDLPTVEGDVEVQRKIIRRLGTNPGDYTWHPGYGAGLRRYVGSTSLKEVEGVCVSQILMEDSVASYPAPTVVLEMEGTSLACSITYTDAVSNQLKSFSFNIQE